MGSTLVTTPSEKKSECSVLLNSRGLSLIEVMIGAAVGLIVIFGISSSLVSQSKEANGLTQKLAAADLQKSMISLLSDGSICTLELTQVGPWISSLLPFDATKLTDVTPPSISLNQILTSHEIDKVGPYNKKLFKRVSRGCYVINPYIVYEEGV